MDLQSAQCNCDACSVKGNNIPDCLSNRSTNCLCGNRLVGNTSGDSSMELWEKIQKSNIIRIG